MKLSYIPGACPLAGHIVLEWIGAPYDTIKLSHESIDSQACRAVNAGSLVPMLQDADFSLTESVAILCYLADVHPEARLIGDGTPRGRAEVMRWLAFLSAEVHTAFRAIFKASHILDGEKLACALANSARKHVRAYLERLDAQLNGRDWLVGTRSIADPYLFVILRWTADLDIGLQGLQHLARFALHMEADDGVRAAIFEEEGVLT